MHTISSIKLKQELDAWLSNLQTGNTAMQAAMDQRTLIHHLQLAQNGAA